MDFSGDFQRPTITAEIRDAVDKATNKIQRSPRLPITDAVTYDPGVNGEGRIKTWLSALDQLRDIEPEREAKTRLLLDASAPGSGKTHSVEKFAKATLSYEHDDVPRRATKCFIYVSANYRSPSVKAIEKSFVELPARHQGIIHEVGPEGTMIRRVIRPDEIKQGIEPDEPASCVYSHRFNAITSKGFGYQDAVSFCSQRCPHRIEHNPEKKHEYPADGTCPHKRESELFWKYVGQGEARQKVPVHSLIRCSMQGLRGMLEVCSKFLFHEGVIFIDESPQLVDASLEIHTLSRTKIGNLLAFLPTQFMVHSFDRAGRRKSPELEAQEAAANEVAKGLTQKLLINLLELLAQIKNLHGIDHSQIRAFLAGWIEEASSAYKGSDGWRLPYQWQEVSNSDFVQLDDYERVFKADGTEAMDALPSPLLPMLVRCVLGPELGLPGHNLSITKARKGNAGAKRGNYRITLTAPSGLPQRLGWFSNAVIVSDATADPEMIKSLFPSYRDVGVAMKQVRTATVPHSQQADVLYFQTKDLGGMTMQRGEHQTSRLKAIRAGAQDWVAGILGKKKPLVGFIEHKDLAEEGDGKWFTGSARGGNMFQDHDALFLVGKPIMNVSAALSEYVSLTGDHTASTGCAAEENSAKFVQFQAHKIAAEYFQALHRIRPIRRDGKQLVVVFISDADLSAMPIDVAQIKASDITPKAAHKTEQKLEAITEAILQLASDGLPVEKISTRKVAGIAAVGERTVRRIAQHQSDGKSWPVFVNSVLKDAMKEDSP